MKNGCRYCKMEANGDVPRNQKDLFLEDAICPNKISISTGKAKLKIENPVFLRTIVSIYKNRMCLSVFDLEQEGSNGLFKDYDGVQRGIKIKYCPMCGRSLGFWEADK